MVRFCQGIICALEIAVWYSSTIQVAENIATHEAVVRNGYALSDSDGEVDWLDVGDVINEKVRSGSTVLRCC